MLAPWTWYAIDDDSLDDKFLGIETRSRVPNVEVYPAGVTVGGSFNDIRTRYGIDPFLEGRSKKGVLRGFRGDVGMRFLVKVSDSNIDIVRHARNLQERF